MSDAATGEPVKTSLTPREEVLRLLRVASAARYLPRLPAAMLEDIFPGIGDLEISMRHEVRSRALAHGEAYVLSLITAYLKPDRIFEIGTGSGQGTTLMARQAPNAHIDTLDLGSEEPALTPQKDEPPLADTGAVGVAFRDTEQEAAITQHFGDSARFDFAPFERQMDLVFVDGAHSYDYVRSDSEAAFSLASARGVIVWDDCSFFCPGVSKALLELRRKGRPISRIFGTHFAVSKSAYAVKS